MDQANSTPSFPSKTNLKTKKALNILLLGKTGVGKSTFINSFANYVTYTTVDEIKSRNDILAPIPCIFTLDDDEDNEIQFKMGEDLNSDENESMNPIKSGTQGCKVYRFDFQDLKICLIDTPGILDTEGIEKDKKNLEDILNFLSLIPSIDGICILLKPNEEKLDAVLEYCVLELLTQLDKSAVQNIVFAFTNSRSTMYRPKGSKAVIRELVAKINSRKADLELKFSKENYFCFDSEAFQYLVSRYEINYAEKVKNMFIDSWNHSRSECVNMINYFMGLPAHDTNRTLAIIKSRKIIESLLHPLVDINENILKNQQLCREREVRINSSKHDLSKLASELYIPKSNVTMEYYKSPRLICGTDKCIQILKEELKETHFKTVCFSLHELPLATAIPLPAITALQLATKETFSENSDYFSIAAKVVGGIAVAGVAAAVYYYWKNGNSCINCDCPISDHFVSYYDTREEIVNVVDKNTQSRIDNEEDGLQLTKNVLKSLKRQQEELERESDCISNASTKFALFLHHRAIADFNDATEIYLTFLIETTKKFGGEEVKVVEKVRRLEMQKCKYQRTKATIEIQSKRSGDASQEIINPEEIDEIVSQLCNLPIYGHLIKNSLEKYQEIRMRDNKTRLIGCHVQKIFTSFLEWVNTTK